MHHNNNDSKIKNLVNTIVEVEIDGKMGLVSLYDDLPHFEYDQTIDNLVNSNTKLKTRVHELKKYVKMSEHENSQLKNTNAILQKNISSLYKTATKEIQRKDNIIQDLRMKQYSGRPNLESNTLSYNDNENKKTPALELELQKEKTEAEEINNSQTLKSLNENDNGPTINVKPDKNIPRTVYYKRLCQKFAKENETNEFKTKKPEEKDNINTNNKDSALEIQLKVQQILKEDINNSDKHTNLNKNNDDCTIVEQPDINISKTVFTKRSSAKLIKENETKELKNKISKEKVEIITDKKNSALELKLQVHQKETEDIKKRKTVHENNDDCTIVEQPDINIPKTDSPKRSSTKFVKENETKELRNKIPKKKVDIITDKKIPAVELKLKVHQKQTDDNKKRKTLHEDDDCTIIEQPDINIPKTVFTKRSSAKFVKVNETKELKSKMPKEKVEIITDKKNSALELKLKVHQKQTEDIKKRKTVHEDNDDCTIIEQPDINIPKKVFPKRSSAKLIKENETKELKSKIPKEKVESITNKKIPAVELKLQVHQKQTDDKKCKTEHEDSDDCTIIEQPDINIPKTDSPKRSSAKFVKENETKELRNKIPKVKGDIITDKKNPAVELKLKVHQKQTDDNKKRKTVHEDNDDCTIIEQPDINIPKTVFTKRSSAKFVKVNETKELKSKIPKEKVEIITDKKNSALELKLKVQQKQNENIKKRKTVHENNDDCTIIEQPDINIPKKVFPKRPSAKLVKENETKELKNKIPKEKVGIITDKKNPAVEVKLQVQQKQTEDIKKRKTVHEDNDDCTIIEQPDINMPKTVFPKRPSAKFVKENETKELKSKIPKEKVESITNKKIPAVELKLQVHQKQIDDIKKRKTLHEDNDDCTIVEQPDINISKTVFPKRSSAKFIKENETKELKSKIPKEKVESITDKKIPDLELKLQVHQKQTEVINKHKKLHENNDDCTIVEQPDINISKTVFPKRSSAKFIKENETKELKSKIPKEKVESITDKKIPAVEVKLQVLQNQTEVINKHKNLLENNDNCTINVLSDNIPKTVFPKRPSAKFIKENETKELKSKIPKEKVEIITDKKIPDLELKLQVHQKQTEDINKHKNLHENNDDCTINVPPDINIPKTDFPKRSSAKFVKEIETIELKNKIPKEKIQIITDNLANDKNEDLINDKNKSINQYDLTSDTSGETSLVNETNLSSEHFEVEHGPLFRSSKKRKVIMHSTSDGQKPTTKKGRRIQLITINNSEPLPSFNGAKKTEIDFSKQSVHIEKVVESSSLFYIPQTKKRRTINFDDCNS